MTSFAHEDLMPDSESESRMAIAAARPGELAKGAKAPSLAAFLPTPSPSLLAAHTKDPVLSLPDTEMLRSDRERDTLLAVAFFGWRWMKRRYSPLRYLVPGTTADREEASALAVPADGSEPLEPKYWTHHESWNRMPVVPHITGSLVGSLRLLETINQMGFMTVLKSSTKNQGAHVICIWREDNYGTVLLVECEHAYRDEAIVQAALALIAPVMSSLPSTHAVSVV